MESRMWRDAVGRDFGFSVRDGARHWIQFDNIGSFLVRTDTLEAAGYPLKGVGKDRLVESFWRWVAPLIVEHVGWGCIHASAVLTPDGIVAFCGPTGRGKSTLAWAWSLQGAEAYSDDTLPFTERDGQIVGARLPQSPRLKGPAATHLPDPRNGLTHQPEAPSGEYAFDLVESLRPLRAIFWLAPIGEACGGHFAAVRRIEPSRAFPMILRQAVCDASKYKGRNAEIVRHYLSLVRQIPVFQLNREAGFDRMPAVLSLIQSHVSECVAMPL